MKERNFGQLGFEYQQTLIKSIIEDKKYAEKILDILEPKYFENASFKFIVQNIKEFFVEYKRVPDYLNLTNKILSENAENLSTKIHIDTIESIKNQDLNPDYTKKSALNFCKQQNLRRVMKQAEKIIDNGNFEEYDSLEGIFKKAIEIGKEDEPISDIFDDIEDALSENYRNPIPTGIVGIDNLLKGGIGKGELGVILAPLGTGKTTILTKFANTAYNNGFNVLHVFFEDNIGDIKRKHFTIWSGISASNQPDNREEVKKIVEQKQKESKGQLKLLKLPSANVTVAELKNRIRKLISDGFKIDLLVIDYVECLESQKITNGDEWKGEGNIMRSIEGMTTEFEIAIWTATQGSRDSISSEFVNTDQMGGSIKKAQIAHVLISVGKSMEQKENNLATLSLLKSRIGKDGIIFQNCKFNNEYLEIDVESQSTLLGFEDEKEKKNIQRAKEAYLLRQEMKTK